MAHMIDSEFYGDLEPAEDGKPWRKSCDVCAFRLCDPQGIGDSYQRHIRHHDGKSAFYCLHRAGEPHRICASYAAINRITSSVLQSEGS